MQQPPGEEPARKPMTKPMGKVRIKERTDGSRILITVVIAAVILGAVGFLVLKYVVGSVPF
jgi:hypothetical protein